MNATVPACGIERASIGGESHERHLSFGRDHRDRFDGGSHAWVADVFGQRCFEVEESGTDDGDYASNSFTAWQRSFAIGKGWPWLSYSTLVESMPSA
ncbi:MAG: hypothetical protein RIS70_4377 [Planctomycetota bacterium]